MLEDPWLTASIAVLACAAGVVLGAMLRAWIEYEYIELAAHDRAPVKIRNRFYRVLPLGTEPDPRD